MYYVSKDPDFQYEEIKIDDKTFYKKINTAENKDSNINELNDLADLDLQKNNKEQAMNKLGLKTLQILSQTGVKRKADQPRRKRYSDQFKDPLFIIKDQFRKLKMIEKFKIKNKDIGNLIDEYKECISKCIDVLKSEYEIKARDIFSAFELKRHGFVLEDFGSESNEEKEDS